MSENEKHLDPSEMRRLLGLLGEELQLRGQSATIYLVGGANIALTVGFYLVYGRRCGISDQAHPFSDFPTPAIPFSASLYQQGREAPKPL